MTGLQTVDCGWCGRPMEPQACEAANDGTVSHGICDACKAAQIAADVARLPAAGVTFVDLTDAAPPRRGLPSPQLPFQLMAAMEGVSVTTTRRLKPRCATAGEVRRAGAYVPPHVPDYKNLDAGRVLETSERALTDALGGAPVAGNGPLPLAARVEALSEPVYWALEYVAAACGVPALTLHNHYKPAHWGVPKDWKYVKGVTLYNDALLPELADSLALAGLTVEADKLRTWWINQRGAAETVSYSRAELVKKAERLKQALPKKSRLAAWEEEHDA